MDDAPRRPERATPRLVVAPSPDGAQDADRDPGTAPGGGELHLPGLEVVVPLPGADDVVLWHVSVTFSGPPVPPEELHAALVRLVDAQPFPATVRYNDERAEISYWDEAEDVDDAAALGLRMWAEHRRAADLPGWRAVGIEVVDRETLRARGDRQPPPAALGDVRPW